MNPAACARAKKELRLANERALVVKAPEPKRLPATPEEAKVEAYRAYRKATRPYRRMFRGIITRREAERFVIARMKSQHAVVQSVTGETP